MIRIRGTDGVLRSDKDLAGYCSLKDPTTGEYFLLKLKETFASFKLGWEVSANARTDGGGNQLA
jgi:hypothetical protein